jgi:hypothetical protein
MAEGITVWAILFTLAATSWKSWETRKSESRLDFYQAANSPVETVGGLASFVAPRRGYPAFLRTNLASAKHDGAKFFAGRITSDIELVMTYA